MLVPLVLLAIIVILIYKYLTWTSSYWKDRNIPGPKPTLLLGNYPSMITQKEQTAYELERIYNEYKGKTPFVGTFSMRTPRLLVLEPELIKTILVKNFKNFYENDFGDMFDKESDPLIGRNPFALTGEEWREKRAEITPAFTTSRIKALLPLMDEVSARMVKYLKDEQGNIAANGIEARELSAKFTTDVVSSCVYSIDAGSFTDEQPAIRIMGKRLMGETMKFFFIMAVNALLPWLKKFYKFSFVSKDVEIFFTDLIVKAVQFRKESNIKRVDYLDHLISLQEKKGISDIDIAAHSISFFADGFETSSIVISYALYQIAKNPDVQNRLRAEIHENLNEDGKLSYEALNEMPYLEQVLSETLRLNPPASFLIKRCTEETELLGLKEKPFTVEKGLIVWIPLLAIQTDPAYFEEPLKFNPDRFAPENGGTKPYKDQSVYFPFGDGPRICLGMRFATCQAKAGIVEIVKNFEISVNFKTQEPLVFNPKEFMLTPIGGLWLNIKPLVK